MRDEELERRIEELERKLEEIAEELSRKIGTMVEKTMREAIKGAMIGPRTLVAIGPRIEEEWIRRPIPIRNLDRSLYTRIKEIADRRGLTVGEVMNEAMRFYLNKYDVATLEKEKERILRKIEEIGTLGYAEPEVRELLLKEYQEMLNEIEKKISELKKRAEGEET